MTSQQIFSLKIFELYSLEKSVRYLNLRYESEKHPFIPNFSKGTFSRLHMKPAQIIFMKGNFITMFID